MAIIYVHTFHAIGNSSDTKPATAAEGMVFWELDTQKVYLFHAGSWRGIVAGSGSWSPAATETLTNKTIVLNNNIVKTTSGNLGIFSFGATGEFVFVPIGSANRFLKVNNSGTGFEFADPAVSGSWNPTAVETLSGKTLVVENNTLKQATPHTGDLLTDNGTKFIPLAKGANNTYFGVNSSGVLGFYATSTLPSGGGGGSSPSSGLTRPSQVGYAEGWWNGGTSSDMEQAYNMLDHDIHLTTSNSGSISYSNTLGKHAKFPLTSSGNIAKIRTDSILFKRNYSSYHLLKFRISLNVPFMFFSGFTSDTSHNYDSASDLQDDDLLMFCKMDDQSVFHICSNSGTSNATESPLSTKPFTTNPHTIEVQADPTNNRFQYRIDDFGGTWNNVTTNIPRTDIGMGLVSSVYSKTSTDFDFEVYLFECANRIMF